MRPYDNGTRSRATRLIAGCLVAVVPFALASTEPQTLPNAPPGLEEVKAIHQEITIDAPRARVYEALMNERQYAEVEKLGVAMRTVLKNSTVATQIDPQAGGSFVIFGGHIVGRNVELVPQQRIVQAWREVTWKPGVYSIVKFELLEDGAGTKIIFDHTGFPPGGGASLAVGWYDNYWQPLREFLKSPH